MGTRADFYVRRDNSMEWLGSIAWDGYPDGIDEAVLKSQTEEDYRSNLSVFFKSKTDFTHPENGWPWPWNDSRTTDYAYIFQDGKVMASYFGYPLFDPLNPPEEEDDSETKMEGYFPDMKDIKNVRFDEGSGIMIISIKQNP